MLIHIYPYLYILYLYISYVVSYEIHMWHISLKNPHFWPKFLLLEWKQGQCEISKWHRGEVSAEVINWGTWMYLFPISPTTAASHEWYKLLSVTNWLCFHVTPWSSVPVFSTVFFSHRVLLHFSLSPVAANYQYWPCCCLYPCQGLDMLFQSYYKRGH